MKGILNEMVGVAAFVRAVQTGSFSAAAKSLGVTPSAASKSVSRLEAEIGAKLLRRSTRTLSLTDEGEAFHARIAPLLREFESAADIDALGDEASGHLRIGLPGELGLQILRPIITEFLPAHPAISLDVRMTDRHSDIFRENLDVVFRVGGATQNTLMTRTLGHLDMVLVASPAFVREFGYPATLEALKELPFAKYAMEGVVYPVRFADGAEFMPEGRVALDSAAAIREAALNGVGVAHLIRRLVQEDLDRGLLLALAPSMPLQSAPLQAIHASGTMPPRRLQLLTQFVSTLFRTNQS
jgi:DNA-binding transcriptional LysR family regulator